MKTVVRKAFGQLLRYLLLHVSQSRPLKEIHLIPQSAFSKFPAKLFSFQTVPLFEYGQLLPDPALTPLKLLQLIAHEF